MTLLILLILLPDPGLHGPAARGALEVADATTPGAPAGPDTLTLDLIYEAARAHFPLAPQAALYREIARESIGNIDAEGLPSVSLNARATYHSEVPNLPVQMPGVALPEVRKDQYQVGLEINQLLYDGGRRAARRDVERASAEAAGESVPVAFNEVRVRINEAYFNALLQDAAAASLNLLKEDLEARRRALQASVEAGTVSEGSLDVLQVEMLELDQRLAGVRRQHRAALDVLEELTGLTLPDDVTFSLPRVRAAANLTPDRPEIQSFRLRREELEQRKALAAVQTHPQVGSFASAAYGRPPGLNMFENEMKPFVSAGVTLQWPFWDRGTARRQRAILDLRKDLLDAEQAAFLQRIEAEAARSRQEILRLRELLASDAQIVRLRSRIADRAATQLESGVISATEYLLERHAEERARLAVERHRIELSLAEVQYLTILGRADEML